MTKDELIEYWLKTSNKDYITMEHLFQTDDYSWSLFIGHLVIEKLLKAYYVKNIDKNVPLIHDLLRLAKKSNLSLSEEHEDFLDTVTSFNIRVRYDDYKLEFYNKCTKDFTTNFIKKIKDFRKWIKKMLYIY
ncbi:MAG: HEPN domain-containing protein [Spirochaetes bacterium]|nr:HEPN domain-containing protein [Spirochaetota bacterium]